MTFGLKFKIRSVPANNKHFDDELLQKKGKYGRWLIEILGADDRGQPVNINEVMLASGHAIEYSTHVETRVRSPAKRGRAMSEHVDLYERTLQEVEVRRQSLLQAKAAGIGDWSMIWAAIVDFIAKAIAIAKELQGLEREQIREKVVAATERFYEEVIVPIDLPGVPNIIEPIVDKALGRAIRPLLAGTIDALFDLYDRLGWPPLFSTKGAE